ncbi:hypothetical protein BC832DRAFT_544920 [Gaertneriomyces semiglobifer]|nr:hypothetical protein BC832DRAFT_544920 [Gaertneriomyces semiglobifer]
MPAYGAAESEEKRALVADLPNLDLSGIRRHGKNLFRNQMFVCRQKRLEWCFGCERNFNGGCGERFSATDLLWENHLYRTLLQTAKMKHLAAYMLATLGGKESPSAGKASSFFLCTFQTL